MQGFSLLEILLIISFSTLTLSLSIGAFNDQLKFNLKEKNQLDLLALYIQEQILDTQLHIKEKTSSYTELSNLIENSVNIKSKDDLLSFYPTLSCSPARVKINHCFLTVSLRCHIKKYC